jgi:TATA-box binding protein (TBP) (component of TFIID and TFIIIB)
MSFSIDDEWMQYLSNQNTPSCVGGLLNKNSQPIKLKIVEESIHLLDNSIVPKCDELYISTKTKVLFLNQEIDINGVFWNIPIIEYWKPATGVIKKQMKIVSKTPEEYKEIQERLQTIPYYTENIIKQINNPEARRIKFKDERKITVGLSRKDIINSRGKIKNAFYNCFAMILRFECQGVFKEIHVKVFNTGKLEIPGILNAGLLDTVKLMILDVLQSYLPKQIEFIDNEDNDNVLINSNFNCGFFINRDKLYAILRSEKYGIETAYEPCSYPGVKCKFYFNNDIGFDEVKQNGKIIIEDRNMKMSELIENKKYTEVSFMIFRTGSCLIVGNCSEKILRFIYNFIKNILESEYNNIHVENEVQVIKSKNVKLRKKTIFMTNEYYNQNCKSV